MFELHAMEYETTVTLAFGGKLYGRLYELLHSRPYVVEDVDVYVVKGKSPDDTGRRQTYRETKRYRPGVDAVETWWDRKTVKRYVEHQVPHVDRHERRVCFITTNYKTSYEEKLTADQWRVRVREDHANDTCLRVANKRRLAFSAGSFSDRFAHRDDTRPRFTRLSLGEYSTYGGTLEARTKCNPLYYLEIEHELIREPEDDGDIERNAELLVETLFTVLPYGLVAETMRTDASATVRRERVDNVFDEFKRRFVDYNRCRGDLWKAVVGGNRNGSESNRDGRPPVVDLFLMPKWDGLKATANYCEGYLFVRDACGSLSTYTVDLPFDNDVVLQLEALNDSELGERLFVVTEIMAIAVRNHDTLYHVYNRSNSERDTGRYAGNVSNSITLKTQFNDANDRCNTYRLVAPRYSLSVFHLLNECRSACPESSCANEPERRQLEHVPLTTATGTGRELPGHEAINTYARNYRVSVLFTTVRPVDPFRDAEEVLLILDRFHDCRPNGESTGPASSEEEALANRIRCLKELSSFLPDRLLHDQRFCRHCEGMLVTFVRSDGRTVTAASTGRANDGVRVSSLPSLSDHGYIKVKPIDTVDLEFDLDRRTAVSASGRYTFPVLGVPDKLPNWADRPRPVTNNRIIIECYYDRGRACLVFIKDRPDKTRPDSDEKISAIDPAISALGISTTV